MEARRDAFNLLGCGGVGGVVLALSAPAFTLFLVNSSVHLALPLAFCLARLEFLASAFFATMPSITFLASAA